MAVSEQFNRIAQEYDKNRNRFIPCFRELYYTTTAFLAANVANPERILDLGAGTGLLSSCWYRHFPQSEYVLTDIAKDMLQIAQERFAGRANVQIEKLDYAKKLPAGAFECIISALSIHHLTNDKKKELFQRIHKKLTVGGLFANYDQFCAGLPGMDQWFDSYWESQLTSSGLTAEDIRLWRERRALDHECSVEEELDMLWESGFREVKCVYTSQKFSVLAALK